jgi:hypothetical protein
MQLAAGSACAAFDSSFCSLLNNMLYLALNCDWLRACLRFAVLCCLQALLAVLVAPYESLQLLHHQQQAAMQASNAPVDFQPCCDSCCLSHNPADNPTAVALSVAAKLGSMAAAGSKLQRKGLLELLLQNAASGSSEAAAAMLATRDISRTTCWQQDSCDPLKVPLLLQPDWQRLLLQALGSSNSVASTAAADVLANLWYDINKYGDSLATLPAYAATLQQAAEEVWSNSSLAAPAAELCWFASKRHCGPSELLVVHAAALVDAAAAVPVDDNAGLAQQQQQDADQQQQQQDADQQQQQQQQDADQQQKQQQDTDQQQQQQYVSCQIFSLAALCNPSGSEGVQEALAGLIAEQQLPPLLQVLLNRQLDQAEYEAAAAAALPQRLLCACCSGC